MIEATFIPKRLDGAELYELLSKHRLLPKNMEDPRACVSIAESSDVGFLHEGERVLAVILETHPTPNSIELIWINEVSKLHQKRDDLAAVAINLRQRWFGDKQASRVGVHVPIARTQTIRTLKSIGFRMETMPWGVRNVQGYGNHLESLAILGLLPDDPVKSYTQDANIIKEVSNGV